MENFGRRVYLAGTMTRPFVLPYALLLVLLVSACAGSGPGAGGQAADSRSPRTSNAAARPAAATTPAAAAGPGDPFEAANRRIFDVNLRLDDAVLRPAAVLYRRNVGRWTRVRIRNFLENLSEPAVAANALLQARPLAAGQSVMRFAVNSTLGLGGLFDLEHVGGPPRQVLDFGQTLYRWGVPDGPYLMVPVTGPSTPRDFAGTIGNGFLNPIGWVLPFGYSAGRTVVYGLDERERNIEALDEVRNGSLDVYARLRSLWRQHRDAELGRTTSEGEGLDILEDPEATGR